MANAQELLREISAELTPLAAQMSNHPYLIALEQGDIPRERLSVFVGEQQTIVKSDMQSFAVIVSRCEAPHSRKFFQEILPDEDAAFRTLDSLATALELDQAWLNQYEPHPVAQAYTHYLAWLAHYGSPAEVAAALLINFSAWGTACLRMGAALRDRYGLNSEATAFFGRFAPSPSRQFEEGVGQVVSEGLTDSVTESKIKRAARLLQIYEAMFWDGVFQASTSDSAERHV